jgi:hypothetical protein
VVEVALGQHNLIETVVMVGLAAALENKSGLVAQEGLATLQALRHLKGIMVAMHQMVLELVAEVELLLLVALVFLENQVMVVLEQRHLLLVPL